MSRNHCKLVQLGLVTALGITHEQNWKCISAGDATHLTLRNDLIRDEERLFGAVTESLPPIPEIFERFACRTNQLALAALEGLRPEVDAAIEKFGAHRVGVVVGSSTVGVHETETFLRTREKSGEPLNQIDGGLLEYAVLCEFIQEASGAGGPCYSLSTACSSGAKALGSARRLLELGVCDAVITGAADSLCGLTANGFDSLQALSSDTLNPMSVHRDGLILGEAAALFLLTREPGGIQLAGVGESSDAHHISSPLPDGGGAYRAMQACLGDSGLETRDVAYLNLHGTGTPQNDAMESAAVHRLFGDRVPCSSTKPLVGHTLGASGAVEAAFCWLMLRNRRDGELSLLPHVYDGVKDPELAPIDLVHTGNTAKVPTRAAIMSNSFGFGGSNCSILLTEGGA
jgi:3-oxoacyl-[acyl-carrier-protein] synthase-1